MRTLALLLAMGMAGAAEAPKPTPATTTPAPRLNTAEITAFNAVEGRMKAIRDEFESLSKQRAEIQADACKRALGVPACEIKPDGTLAKFETSKDK